MSPTEPLVSVIIPYCNRPQHLDLVLTAYERQSYDDVELLIVCDGLCSKNDLEQVTRGRGVKCFWFRPDQGFGRMGLSRNIGASNAQGEIFLFNDVDVIPESAAVERIVSVHSENRVPVLCGKIWRIEGGLDAVKGVGVGDTNELKRISRPMEYDPSLQWSTIRSVHKSDFWWSFISGFCSFTRHEFLSLTGYDPFYVGWGYEDTDLGYRLLTHGTNVAFFEDIAGFHLDHPENGLKIFEALRNLDRLTTKFPELKSSRILVNRRRELMKEIAGKKSPALDADRSRFGRFAAHSALYSRILHRKLDIDRLGSIAVVIPARNRAQYLRETVLSAVHQTRSPEEVYIIVDPSDDGTRKVAEELAQSFPEVRCINNTKNRGVAESRNQGVVASASDYIMFLDSDDVLKSSYFEKVASLLDRNRKVGIAYSDYEEFDGRSRVVRLPVFDARHLLVDCIVMGPAMARRRALEQSGGYDAEQVFEDWELWIRVVEQGWSGRGVHEPLYQYRVHPGNRDLESNKIRKAGEDLIYQKHLTLYKRYGIDRAVDGKWIGAPSYAPYR